MESVRTVINPAVRFLLELCLLAALAYTGFRLGPGVAGGILLAVAAPALAALAWGRYNSPKAAVKLPLAGRIAVEAFLFGCAVAGLAVTGRMALAATLGATELVSGTLKHYWER